MIVKKLQLLNFQVIKEFNADFEGNVYFITGDNELGKSTVLKAIGALLTGNRDAVLRKGEKKGFAKMVVGDDGEEYNVELKFTEANPRGTITIKQKSNGAQTNNVTMLQKIFGYIDFDAVEFSRWSETAEGRRKQIEVVKGLLPTPTRVRIEQIDKQVVDLKAERTEVNREVKLYKSVSDSAAESLEPGDVEKFAEPVDISDLLDEQRENARLIEKAKTVRAAHAQRVEQLKEIPARRKSANATYDIAVMAMDDEEKAAKEEYERVVANAKKEYEEMLDCIKQKRSDSKMRLEDDLALIDAEESDFEKRKANAEKWLEDYEANNPEEMDTTAQLQMAQEHNRRNAVVVDYLEKKKAYDDREQVAAGLDEQINALSDERAALIGESELPIAGLSFTDDGLELNGTPFVPGKVSDSQIMEVAAKLIIASNPTVKVFRIARGESLGARRLQAIIEIAKKNGFQGFIEEVKRGQDDLVIEEYTEAE